MLPEFITYLEKNKLMEFDIMGEFESHLWNRFRLQIYVFFAQRFGLDMGYQYDMHLCVPHSTGLTEAYCELAEKKYMVRDGAEASLPESFNSDGFLNVVQYKSDRWLEIAATLMDYSDTITERESLVSQVEYTKYVFSTNYINDVLDDLLLEGLVNLKEQTITTTT